MKTKLFFVLFLITTLGFSQKSNQIKIYYGYADGVFWQTEDNLTGDWSGSPTNISINEIGIGYQLYLKKKLFLETGVNYFSNTTKTTSTVSIPPFTSTTYTENFQLLSFPIFLGYDLGKYFYANGGFLVDAQLNETNRFQSQSGIGFGLGLGAKYNFSNWTIFINPQFRQHSLIKFKDWKYTQKLAELGIRIGVGYNF